MVCCLQHNASNDQSKIILSTQWFPTSICTTPFISGEGLSFEHTAGVSFPNVCRLQGYKFEWIMIDTQPFVDAEHGYGCTVRER